ncbi:MAG: NADP-dependent oxidoreductase [Caldilineaceae bacterium]|nr:NADP-dependent oxidoreductase [Caldilineaceae bacterium]
MSYSSREVHLVSRPMGEPTPANFEVVTAELPALQPGQVLVRNRYLSVDPYMRGRMVDRKSYVPPFRLGEVMTGGAVGEVVESNGGPFQAGDWVQSMQGWREAFVSDGRGLSKVDPALAPLPAYLGVMGMPGLTAYVGLLDMGKPQAGETVYVSGAAGAVGSIVCQIAKLKGCYVTGSAGSDAKTAWLMQTAGVDAAFNYKTTPVPAGLARSCPNGIDVFFDNVGGDTLEAALGRMNDFGRIAACGSISLYNATRPEPGPRNLGLIVPKRLTLQGFIVSDHDDRMHDFYRDMSRWIAAGRIKWEETVYSGIDNAVSAFLGLFSGKNLGKMVVEI